MNDPKELVEKLMSTIQGVIPANLGDDIKANISAVISKSVKELDLVSREELDIQTEVLAKTRDKLSQLETKLTELEKKMG